MNCRKKDVPPDTPIVKNDRHIGKGSNLTYEQLADRNRPGERCRNFHGSRTITDRMLSIKVGAPQVTRTSTPLTSKRKHFRSQKC
jgi:hypothetical protein